MRLRLASAIALAALTVNAAESPFVRELTQLQASRDRAVTVQVQQIDAKYSQQLQQLLQRATRAGDLDAAIAIRDRLNKLGTAAADSSVTAAEPRLASTSRRGLLDVLTNCVCYWIEGGNPTNAPKGSFRVSPDGTLVDITNHLYVRKCEVLNGRYMKLQTRWTQVCVFDFDDETGLAKQVNKYANYMFQPEPVYIRVEQLPK